MRPVMRHGSPEKAARRVAFLASSPAASAYTGEYFERKPTPRPLSAREVDRQLQERAWQLASALLAGAPTNHRLSVVPGSALSGARLRPVAGGQE